jgi:predicted enzyme related to lactoylglutathione lyase
MVLAYSLSQIITQQPARFSKLFIRAGIPVIVFGVEDIQQEYERMKELEVVFIKEPTKTEWETETIFEDTCGNFIQLMQK